MRILAMPSGLVLVRRVRAALMSQGESVHAIGESDLSYGRPRMRQHATSRNRIQALVGE